MYIERQLTLKGKSIRVDKEPELTQENALKFYLNKGIQQQSSCTDTPQQNGVVERKQRHILETARYLMFQSNLPMNSREIVFNL